MRRIFLIFIACLMFQIGVLGQAESPPCPKLSVTGSSSVIYADSGDTITFSVSVDNLPENLKIEYLWEVSAGKIASGQRTPVIKVDIKDLGNTNVTATVEIKGLPKNCPNAFSETQAISKGEPLCLNTYKKVSQQDGFSEMEQVMIFLQQAPDVSVVFYLSFNGKPTQKQINYRILQMLKPFALRKRLGELNRITFIIGDDKEEYTRICYFSEELEKLNLSGSNIIKGVNINLRKLSKSKKPKK